MPEIGQAVSHYGITERLVKVAREGAYRACGKHIWTDVRVTVLPSGKPAHDSTCERYRDHTMTLTEHSGHIVVPVHASPSQNGLQDLVMIYASARASVEKPVGRPPYAEEVFDSIVNVWTALKFNDFRLR